jgi:hypothetical protein
MDVSSLLTFAGGVDRQIPMCAAQAKLRVK